MNFTYEYLPWRGVSAETFKQYGVLTKINSEGKPISIGFKHANGDTLVRLLDKKDFFWVKSGSAEKPGLFGKDKFSAGSHKYITVTEGGLDACSVYDVLRNGPVVAVQSSGSAVSDCILDRDYLNSFERIYFAFDSDAPGREALARCAKLFDYNKVFVLRFSNRKDANEYLQHNEREELRNIWWNSKKYLPETITSSLDDFKKILENPLKVGIPYPFQCLTDMTGGIRTGEFVLITAQEKVGKTEMMHFFEHKLLKETEDNVAAIFLEEPQQRHLLALAGLEIKKPIHLPDCDCPITEAYPVIEKLLKKDDRLYLYNHFGSNDPDTILDTIRFLVSACGCRYVLLDHISMVVSGLSGEDERRTLDYLSTRLEMMVKELDFSLIAVSHLNDEGKTRGSRYLTKVSDITINAARDLMNEDPVERNTIHLSIPYSRYPGKTGKAGKIVFDPAVYAFKEFPELTAGGNYGGH